MTREEILAAIRPYFDVDELVCDHTYARWKEQSWRFTSKKKGGKK